jgi:ABC-type multidrug transport system fused ATPase/permease subunit
MTLRAYRELLGGQRAYTAKVVALDALAAALNFLEPLVIFVFINEVILKADLNLLFVVIGVRLTTVTAARYLRWLHRTHRARLGQRILCELRQRLFRHFLEQPPGFFESHPPGQLVALTTAEVDAIDAVHRAALAGWGFAFAFATILVVCMLIDPGLTAVILAPVPLTAVVVLLDRRMRRRSGAALDAQARMIAFLEQRVPNVLTTQAFSREPREQARFAEVARGVLRARARLEEAGEAKTNFADLIRSYAMTGILLFGGIGIIRRGDVTLGAVMAMSSYAIALYLLLNEHVETLVRARQAAVALRRVAAILAIAPPLRLDGGGAPLARVEGHVEFESVWFRYAPDEPWVVRDVSFSVPAGKRVAVVGLSGSGKSTLFQLLLRFHDPSRGTIRVDGHDLARLRLDDVRRQIALATQEAVVLADMTVGENIGYAREGAAPDAVAAAAHAALAHDFIARLPHGYDTLVGEGSAALSGGQRQRIALARVILKDAPVLLLDEFTAALDAKTEAEIGAALERFSRGHRSTTIVIAHRLSTIIDADEILVMDQGAVVQRGTHRELYAQAGGLYRLLFERQFRGVIDSVAPERQLSVVPG